MQPDRRNYQNTISDGAALYPTIMYSKGKPLNTSFNRKLGKHGQKDSPEPVPLLVLKKF